MARLSGDVRSLKASVEALREGVDKGRGEAGRHAAALDRLERADKAAQTSAQDAAARLARLAEQLDRLERMEADPARFAGLTERLDRIERQAATLKATAPEPVQTGALQPPSPERQPEAKAPETRTADAKAPDPRTIPVEGWVLRDVYDGMALVESRNKRLHEVAPGQSLPGVGRIEAIERRGKAWFVVTQKGVIGMDRWW
jgi:TolA-binding protein